MFTCLLPPPPPQRAGLMRYGSNFNGRQIVKQRGETNSSLPCTRRYPLLRVHIRTSTKKKQYQTGNGDELWEETLNSDLVLKPSCATPRGHLLFVDERSVLRLDCTYWYPSFQDVSHQIFSSDTLSSFAHSL